MMDQKVPIRYQIRSGANQIASASRRIGSLFSDKWETREINYIAFRIARDELAANGWDLTSEEGQQMISAGATVHVIDAVYEFDCRWEVRFLRWIRGLPPRSRFVAAAKTLREIRGTKRDSR
jgi:hypothetical protein